MIAPICIIPRGTNDYDSLAVSGKNRKGAAVSCNRLHHNECLTYDHLAGPKQRLICCAAPQMPHH